MRFRPGAARPASATLLGPLLAPLALLACATPERPAPPAAKPPPDPGLAALLGRGPEAAIALVGPVRLDRREGEARHLQFGGSPCILDLYYYRPEAGAAPVARHADARRPDGSAIAPGDCLRLLQAARAS